MVIFEKFHTETIQTIGGSRGHVRRCPPPPPRRKGPILSFLHTFLPKSTRIGGPRPLPMGPRFPFPLREILDPPLKTVK